MSQESLFDQLQSVPDLENKLKAHSQLVKKIAGSYVRTLTPNVDRHDLEQAGMIGLCEALVRHNPLGDASFKTYASLRILGAMRDEVRSMDHLSRAMRKKHSDGIANTVFSESKYGEVAPEPVKELTDHHLRHLLPVHRQIMRLRLKGFALTEIGDVFGITDSRVCQIIDAATEQLARLYRAGHL